MNPLDLALEYLRSLFSGDLERLEGILAADFTFDGPFHHFDSAKDYLAALRADPPAGFKYTLLQTYQDASSACLIYHFSKPGVEVPMAQVFHVQEIKISRTRLIFDTGPFAGA